MRILFLSDIMYQSTLLVCSKSMDIEGVYPWLMLTRKQVNVTSATTVNYCYVKMLRTIIFFRRYIEIFEGRVSSVKEGVSVSLQTQASTHGWGEASYLLQQT